MRQAAGVRSMPGVRALGSLFSIAAHLQALREALGFVGANYGLLYAMARRELVSRYSGQALGVFWAIGHPLFQMALLVFVFGVVFKQRIGGTHELPRDYTIYILSGLSAWLSFSPILSTSPTSISGNGNLIKQFTFDARILPVRDVLVHSVVWFVSIGLVALYTLIKDGGLPWTYILLPAVGALHALTAMGCSWALGAIGVFFRDIKDVIVLVSTGMMYVLPVVYLPAWVPALFKPIIYLNPFSSLIWVYQDVLYFGRIEHPLAWLMALVFALVAFTSGYRMFRRLRPMFGSAL